MTEIIKNSFLYFREKKYWVTFCIHDENPFLEGYTKKILAQSHTPIFVLELKDCRHISHALVSTENNFEFVITLESDVVILSAKTWNIMIDWVNILKLKLREMKILSPKENIYTKPPEIKPMLLSTRNPRDPLPQRPMNVSDIPGLEQQTISETAIEEVEVIEVNGADNLTGIETHVETMTISTAANDDDDNSDDPITIPIFNFATSNTSSQNLINLLSNPLRHSNHNRMPNFSDNYAQEANDDDDDDIFHEASSSSLLHIDFVEEIDMNKSLNDSTRDNITIIELNNIPDEAITNNKSVESVIESKPKHIQVKDQKVTKIKIEMDYDQLFLASTSPKKNGSVIVNSGGSVSAIRNGSSATTINEPIAIPSTSTAGITIKSQNSTPKKVPVPKVERKMTLREQQVFQLEKEIGNDMRFKLRKKDCIDTIALINAFGGIWIAGFKPNPLLYVLHIGDQLMAINGMTMKSAVDANKFIKSCVGLFIDITIKRLPLARVFAIKRDFEGQCLGFVRDGTTATIVEIIPNSLAARCGIPPRAPSCSMPTPNGEQESSFWVITEINFRPLSFFFKKNETDLLLKSIGLETSVLLQPSDFIQKMTKELKSIKNYRDYTLQ
ncbi:unnamed protein product [Diamesa hyperborea]